MPRYLFTCPQCNPKDKEDLRWDIERPIEDFDKEFVCPECNVPARRVFSLLGIHFKGGGFTRRGLN